MNKSQFISHINNRSSLNENEFKSLTELAKSFPYCQISHILLAKVAHNSNSMHANETLKKAALYSPNRTILKQIINSKERIETTSTSKIVEQKSVEDKKSIVIESKPEPTVKKSETGNSSIADEIQKTLLKSQSIKKDFPTSEKTITQQEIKQNKTKEGKEKKKPESIVKEDIPFIDVGFSIFSSRLGNVISTKNEFTTEYPYNTSPYRDRIPAEKSTSNDIIDEFIEKSPSISKITSIKTDNSPIENLAERSIKRKSTPKTETLAKLYLSQGNKKKALKIYEELLLKIPEKRTYFASQIEKIKEEK